MSDYLQSRYRQGYDEGLAEGREQAERDLEIEMDEMRSILSELSTLYLYVQKIDRTLKRLTERVDKLP